MIRKMLAALAMVALAGCAADRDLDETPDPIGDFSFGHNIVVAPNALKGPVSRDAEAEEWVSALKTAIGDRFDRYEGDRLYHFGVSVQGYVLARPGVPIVASPKSILIFNIDVWDDALGEKLNTEKKQITVFESTTGQTFIGSGLTQSKEQQMANLSRNAAKLIQVYLEKQYRENDWFKHTDPDGAETGTDTAESGAEAAGGEASETAETAGEESPDGGADAGGNSAETTVDPLEAGETATETSQQDPAEGGEDATDA